MIVTTKKRLPFQILLGLCCAVPYLNNYELTFALWSLTVLLTLKESYSQRFLSYAICFVAIIGIALVSTDFSNGRAYYMFRDATYLMKPVLGLLLGYQICRFLYSKAIETVIYGGLGVSIIHIILILKSILLKHHLSVAQLREDSGYFSDFEVYALILVIFHANFGVQLSKKRYLLLLAIIGFSSFMYLSRTNFIQFVVLYLAMKGYFVLTKRAITAIVSVVLGALVFYSAVLIYDPRRTGSGVDEFLYKVKVAPTEPFQSKVNLADYKDFNLNYRSVELIFTLEQVKAKGTTAMLFGSGLGSQIDLKQEVYLGDMELRFISVLHNAFMTTYLKSGILGALILAFSIYVLSRQKRSQIPIVAQINRLIIGTCIFLLVSNWVLMGYYFTQDSKSILVGLMLAYTEITRKRHLQNNPEPQLT